MVDSKNSINSRFEGDLVGYLTSVFVFLVVGVVVLDSFSQCDLALMSYFEDVLKSCTARVSGLNSIFFFFFFTNLLLLPKSPSFSSFKFPFIRLGS